MIDKNEVWDVVWLTPKQCKGCVFAITKYPYGEQWSKASCVKYPENKPGSIMENKQKCKYRLVLEDDEDFNKLPDADKEKIKAVIRAKNKEKKN